MTLILGKIVSMETSCQIYYFIAAGGDCDNIILLMRKMFIAEIGIYITPPIKALRKMSKEKSFALQAHSAYIFSKHM